jgi:hypothetical protein
LNPIRSSQLKYFKNDFQHKFNIKDHFFLVRSLHDYLNVNTNLVTLTWGAILAQKAENPPNVNAKLTHDSARNIKLNNIAGGIILQG